MRGLPPADRQDSGVTPSLAYLPALTLFCHRRCFQAAAAYPFEDGAILPAILIAMPALAAVVCGQVIAHVAGAVRRPGGLDQHQALGWIVDVHHVHGVLIVVFAVLV